MENIFVNWEYSKKSERQIFNFKLPNKINLKIPYKNIVLSNLSYVTQGKEQKILQKQWALKFKNISSKINR